MEECLFHSPGGREGKGSPVIQTDKGSPGRFVLVIQGGNLG